MTTNGTGRTDGSDEIGINDSRLPVPDVPNRVFAVVPADTQEQSVAWVRSAMLEVGEPPLFGADPSALPISLDLRVRLQAARDAGYVLPDGMFTAANGTYGVTFPAGNAGTQRRIEFSPTQVTVVEEVRGLFRKRNRTEVRPAARRRGVHQFTYKDRDELAAALAGPRLRPLPNQGDGEPYYRIIAVASDLVDELRASKAWNSEYLDFTASKFSPTAEIEEIREHAQRLAGLHGVIGTAVSGDSPEAVLARKHQGFQREQLDVLTESLIRRVASLHHYVGLVADLSEKVAALEQLEQASRIDLQLEEAFQQFGRDELARQHYRELEMDLAGVRASVEYLIASLSGEAGSRSIASAEVAEGHRKEVDQ